jgi:hypothetical protein
MPCVDRGRTGALVAGASGALLMASMFLPWFGLDTGIELGGDAGSASVEAARLNAFEAFGVIDVVLFVSAGLGIALAIRALLPSLPDNPLLATAVILAAALSAVLIVYRLLDPPSFPGDFDQLETATGRRIGAFFGLLGAAGLALGASRAGAGQPNTSPD